MHLCPAVGRPATRITVTPCDLITGRGAAEACGGKVDDRRAQRSPKRSSRQGEQRHRTS